MKLALIGDGDLGRAFARLLERKRSAYPLTHHRHPHEPAIWRNRVSFRSQP